MRKKINSIKVILIVNLPIYLIGLPIAYYLIFDNTSAIGFIILLYLFAWFFAIYCEYEYMLLKRGINGKESIKDEGKRLIKLIFIFPIALLLHFAATIITFHKVLF
tara:strand:+ start:3348 stop:3665 length:318 start_codon:yes stop_codon:yes gene_type:complete